MKQTPEALERERIVDCPHTITRGRPGEPAGRSWCEACGALALDIDKRPCSGCRHFFSGVGYSGCRRHLMAVSPNMNVCFKPSKGTCWEAAFDPHLNPGQEG